MSKYLLVAGFVLMSILSASRVAALEVAEVVLTTAVVEREPVDQVEAFPRQGGRLYCFSRIAGASEPTTVYHLWYRGEQLMSRVVLPVNSPDWRTWSVKRLHEDEPGEWRVEIQDAAGNFLQQIIFELL